MPVESEVLNRCFNLAREVDAAEDFSPLVPLDVVDGMVGEHFRVEVPLFAIGLDPFGEAAPALAFQGILRDLAE